MADENTPPVVDDVKADEVKVDESSVKPDLARRNSLEKHLAHRPERAELVESKAGRFFVDFFIDTSNRPEHVD